MSYLYRINWHNKIYIGELRDEEKDPLIYHVKSALPWLTGTSSGWEIDLENEAKENGWKQTLKTFYNVGIISYADARNAISKKLDQLALETPGSIYYQKKDTYKDGTMLQNIQGVVGMWMSGAADTDTLLIESLLICTNAWQHTSLNQHINTSSRYKSVTRDIVQSLFAPNKLIEYEKKIHTWLPRIYFTFDLKKIPRDIKKMLKSHYRRGVDIINETEFIQQLGGVITDKTAESLTRQLNTYKKKLAARNDDTARAAMAQIDNFIANDIPTLQGGKTTYQEINALVHKAFEGNAAFTDVRLLNGKESESMSAVLYQFFDNFHIDSIFTPFPNFQEKINTYVKTSMTNKIQSLISDVISYNQDYSAGQHKKYSDTLASHPRNSNFVVNRFPKTGSQYDNWVREIIKSKIPSSWSYILNHWTFGTDQTSIYGEQISIWLQKSNGDNFYRTNMPALAWQPFTAENITNY